MFRDFPPELTHIGIPWYRRADYERVREIMTDGQRLPATFYQWQGKAESVEREARRAGRTPVRVHLDPEQFRAWCETRGLNVDAHARTLFASDPANWPVAAKH